MKSCIYFKGLVYPCAKYPEIHPFFLAHCNSHSPFYIAFELIKNLPQTIKSSEKKSLNLNKAICMPSLK
jgi:hypothetical protein